MVHLSKIQLYTSIFILKMSEVHFNASYFLLIQFNGMDDTITTKDAHKAIGPYWQDEKFQVALIYAVTGKLPDTFWEKRWS